MAKKATTPTTTTRRRCIGSARFGIEAHEAAIDDFPVQPSRPDGLGLMCKPHWTEYTRGLRQARAGGAPAKPAAKTPGRKARRSDTPMAHVPTREARASARRAAKAPADAEALAAAEALIAQVDALPGPEMVRRVGDDDVQAALEMVVPGGAGTPLGESLDGGAEEADAA